MNQGKKIVKRETKTLKKKKSWKKWEQFNRWCRKRNLSQKARLSFLMGIFIITIPYQIFKLQTFIASWEIYENSNIPYRIGDKISKRELKRNFVEIQNKRYPCPRYLLKEEYKGIEELWTARYPYEFLPFSQHVVGVNSYKEDFYLYEIESGMEAEQVKEIMKKHGYPCVEESPLREYMGKKRGTKFYCKGGIIVAVGEEEGKIGSIGIYLCDFCSFLFMRYGGGSFRNF